MNARRLRAIVAVAIALVAVGAGLAGPLRVPNPVDVRAFYCAGAVANSGYDPYRVEPLRACEDRTAREAGQGMLGGVVIPAPLPGYDVALFRALALVPFGFADGLVALVTLLSVACATIALQRLTGTPPLAAFALLALCDCYVSLLTGQIAATAIGAGALAALALAAGRPRFAALGVAVACLEPHLGAPVFVACAIAVPTMRRPLAVAAAALAALTLGALPPSATWEFATVVLPAHVRSEYGFPIQYSLAGILAALGVAPGPGIAIANAQYVLTVAAAIAVAIRRRAGPRDPVVALAPLAAAAAGGPFLHLAQVAAAVPLLVFVARGERDARVRATAAVALALLAMPWGMLDENATPGAVAALFAALVATAAGMASRLRPLLAAAIAAANAGVALAIAASVPMRHDDAVGAARALAAVDPRAIAETSWQLYANRFGADPGHALLAAHVPTWLGLLCGAVAFAAAGGARERGAACAAAAA